MTKADYKYKRKDNSVATNTIQTDVISFNRSWSTSLMEKKKGRTAVP